MQLAHPYVLLLLLLVLPLTGLYIWYSRKGGSAITVSSLDGLRRAPKTIRCYLVHVPFVLKIVAFTMIVIALARPRDVLHSSSTLTEGIDIVLAIDISGSMLARDFQPDRMTAAKEVAGSFISDRYGDRIGLVAFAGESFTVSPLTTDQSSLQTLLSRLRSGIIEDGTAIGNGLATAINRLRESEAKSKVIILLTDGVNNRGQIAPQMAANIAHENGIKVYTIGVGTRGKAPYPAQDQFGNITYVDMDVEIDEQMLTKIAETTGGEYFRATSRTALKAIYDQINEMEKSKVEVSEYTSYSEKFVVFLLLALGAMILEFLFSRVIINRIP